MATRTPDPQRSTRRTRRGRPRPVPRWLREAAEVDAVAKARCLLLLDVLSGRVTVTEALGQARLARPTYYQLEQRALEAMLQALTPGAESAGSRDRLAQARRVAQLEGQVQRLEQARRRAERLLVLTRKVLPLGGARRARRARAGQPRRPTAASGSAPSP